MVSKQTIKDYDFNTLEDYFNYIVESKINGQPQQAKELYNNLSLKQKDEFRDWYCAIFESYTEYTNFMKFLTLR